MPVFDESVFLEGLSELGIFCDEKQLNRFRTYSGELALWNGRMNLVGSDLGDFTIRHLLDCLAPLRLISSMPHETIVDIGSGAGLPGIPLAVMLPAASVTLIERSGKKAGFLRNCVALLNLKNLSVIESSWAAAAGSFDILTCRAFADMGIILRAARRLLREGGVAAAYKGRREEIERELSAAGFSRKESGGKPNEGTEGTWVFGRLSAKIKQISVPFLIEERTLAVLF